MTTTTLRDIAQLVLNTGASLAQLAGESRDYSPDQRREIASREIALLDMRANLLIRGGFVVEAEPEQEKPAPPWPGSWRPDSLEDLKKAAMVKDAGGEETTTPKPGIFDPNLKIGDTVFFRRLASDKCESGLIVAVTETHADRVYHVSNGTQFKTSGLRFLQVKRGGGA